MAEIILKMKCSACGGDGEVPSYSGGEIGSGETCEWPGCVDGYIETGTFEIDLDGLSAKLDAIDTKLDVIEAKIDNLE